MHDHAEKARSLFFSGYNCSQSVLLAFSDVTGLDETTAAMISSGFGGGMGRMREVCGSVSGMFMAASLILGYSTPKDTPNKIRTYEMIRRLASDFKAKNGSIICKELLGLEKAEESAVPEERTPEYYKKRPCPDIIYGAAKILDDYLNELDEERKTK